PLAPAGNISTAVPGLPPLFATYRLSLLSMDIWAIPLLPGPPFNVVAAPDMVRSGEAVPVAPGAYTKMATKLPVRPVRSGAPEAATYRLFIESVVIEETWYMYPVAGAAKVIVLVGVVAAPVKTRISPTLFVPLLFTLTYRFPDASPAIAVGRF